MDNGPGANMPMGSNGQTMKGDGPNVTGPATSKPESRGPKARAYPALTPMSAK